MNCPFCSEDVSYAIKPQEHPILVGCNQCMNPFVLSGEGESQETHMPKGVQDVREISQEGSIGAEIIRYFPEAVENMPVLPETAHRIMGMLNDEDSSMADIAELVEQDSIIAGKVLQLANSALYGGLSEINDLKTACARLGVRSVSNAVQAVVNGPLYSTKQPKYQDMMREFWRHAVASAHCAAEIANAIAEPQPDTLFAGGLIHDIGKVLLLDILGSHDDEAIQMIHESPELLQEVLESYHGLLGLHIIQHWGLPPDFGVMVYCHDSPESVPHESWLQRVHIVDLASSIAYASGFGSAEEDMSLLSHESTKFLNLNDIKIAVIRADLDTKIAPLIELQATA
jgi:HD-like signal output (HDOD) protein